MSTKQEQNDIIAKMWKDSRTVAVIQQSLIDELGFYMEEPGIRGRVQAMIKKGILEKREKGWHVK